MFQLLVCSLHKVGYRYQTLSDYIENPETKVVILRHDIDITAIPALRLAKLEKKLKLTGTYFFRTTKFSFNPQIINEIARLGHEIGYHYEDLTRNSGNIEKAKQDFEKHLAMFREINPVQTVCMHGRSGSPFDNRDLWKTLRLSDYGLLAEPYLSLDFDRVLYLSDTTQKWDGDKISLRDNVKSSMNLSFRTTRDILNSIDKLPDQIMITIHPELWSRGLPGWLLARLFVITHGAFKRYYRNPKTQKMQALFRNKPNA